MVSNGNACAWVASALVWLLTMAVAASGQVAVTPITYHGWQGAVEISNADARVVVVPDIGRIMYYGFAGDTAQNVLWNDPALFGQVLRDGLPASEDGEFAWTNFGGDKVWPNQQDDFEAINGHGWPPDHWFDGGAHNAELLTDGVRITSQVSAYNGARSIREIRLASSGTRVTIRQRLEKLRPAARSELEPLRYTIWNVTQIRPPEQTLYPLNPHSALPERYRSWESIPVGDNFSAEGNIGIVVPEVEEAQKTGADSDRWLAAIVGQTVMGEFFRRDSTQEYPDGGLSAEVYSNTDYTELELLSPFTYLSGGDVLEFPIAWELHRLPVEAKTPGARRRAALDWLWEQPSPDAGP